MFKQNKNNAWWSPRSQIDRGLKWKREEPTTNGRFLVLHFIDDTENNFEIAMNGNKIGRLGLIENSADVAIHTYTWRPAQVLSYNGNM